MLVGLAWPWLARLSFGRLPGDILIEREHLRIYIYVPITTMLLLSLAVSLIARFFK